MAKYERQFTGDFDAVLSQLCDGVMHGSISASYEDGSDWTAGDTRCAVRVFERYSALGQNRVSMNLTLLGRGEDLFLTVITSGGSQGMMMKFNTFGEKAFLDTIRDLADNF